MVDERDLTKLETMVVAEGLRQISANCSVLAADVSFPCEPVWMELLMETIKVFDLMVLIIDRK